jgi:hypothetical protein
VLFNLNGYTWGGQSINTRSDPRVSFCPTRLSVIYEPPGCMDLTHMR